MGKVAMMFRIMPDSTETNLETIKHEIARIANPGKIEEKPVAFGLKALEFVVVREDKEGGTDKFEEAFAKITGVSGVEVVDVTLI